jgi:hypothetical protein
MDGRVHQRQEALAERVWLAKVCAGVALWVCGLYALGGQLGVLYISVSMLTLFYYAMRHGPRTQSSVTGYSALNAGGSRAAGEMSSKELDAHLRNLPPPQPGSEGTGSSGGSGSSSSGVLGGGSAGGEAAGKVLGGGPVPAKNELLAQLAAQRAARAAAQAPSQ